MPGFPVHHQHPELTQTHVHRVSDAIQPSHPVIPLYSCHQSFSAARSFPVSLFFASGGQSVGASALASYSNEYSRLISFRIDSFDLLAVQGTPKSFLQCHNSKASILQCSAFFMVQFSHLYMTTGKTLANHSFD